MIKMTDNNFIPRIPDDLIEGKIEGHHYFFNPRGHHGVLVLFSEALEVFNNCRKNLSFQEMRQRISWIQSDPQRLEQIVATLGQLEMINLDKVFSKQLQIERKRNHKKRMMVWLQLTDSCNLCCGYCYIQKRPTHMNLELAKRLVAKVVSDCKISGFNEVVFKLAGGEPTLYWDDGKALIDWAKIYFNDSAPQVKFSIITNGTLLPKSLVGYLGSRQLGISLSLDGVEEWHNKQRRYLNGFGSFHDIDSNINKLLVAGVRPFILTTVTKDNICGITKLAEYCIQRDLDFRFSFYRDTPGSPDELKNDNLQLIEELLKCYEWIANNLPIRSLYQVHKFGDMDLRKPKIRACGIGSNGITLNSDGEVCICQYEMSGSLGNALECDIIQTIKTQEQYCLTENSVEQIPVCKDCKWRFVCGGGCPFLTKRHYGTFQHHSPYCEVYKSVLPVLVELHALQLIREFKKKGGN